ncbi:ABC transporter permease [Entomomonas asaccharolytica]|uniref:ABC transporter permease n=1 Tax=Entomomonas asaccharolytica TaxID=2785331 RepID=A0A974RY68_9GAMM|nr:ABC transporter permease [Entomomonas asaccharolytica]QQP87006.1 ABC transporter permease [Entomomonas asaccharolytica]
MSKSVSLKLFTLAFRQLLRDIKAGELRILFFALMIAVTCSTAIGYFSARLQASMEAKAGEFLAADLVIRGSSPATTEQINEGEKLGLKQAKTVSFSTVVINQDEMQLVGVKAVDNNYPLRGQLKYKTAFDAMEQITSNGPPAGEIWAEQRLFIALNVNLGDIIHIGNAQLRVTKILTYEPDRSMDFYTLNPHILMNMSDLAATNAIQPGSRASYRQLWAGNTETITQYHTKITPTIAPHQRILTGKDGNMQLNNTLSRGENYLNLASLVAILLASVAVALSANQFATRRFDSSALLRCLGLSRKQVLTLYTLQLIYIGLIACILGAALGWLVQLGLFKLLAGLVSGVLPSVGLTPALAGIATGLIALAGFAIPPLAALGNTPPIRVLRQDIFPTPPRSWFVYGLAILALAIIMWRLSLDIKLTLSLMGGGLIAVAMLGGLLLWGLKGLRKLLTKASLPWRLGLGQLLRYPIRAIGQILAFGVILMAMALIILLRSELLDTWQKQLPKNAPNYFAMNITDAELPLFQQKVKQLSNHIAPYYPIIAGRLTEVKGTPVAQLNLTGRGDNATHRDLSLTWTATLPSENIITSGTWWSETSDDQSVIKVSLEDELAKSLGANIGDQLTFVIGGVEYKTIMTSTRKINWDNFQPNFFVIFDPESVQNIPATYLTSFYIPTGNDKEIVELARNFPTVTLLDIDGLLKQLNSILAQVTIAVEYILLFVLFAGITVLFAGLQSTLDNRIRQGALLRALGAKRQLLKQTQIAEFALLGAMAGGLAAIGCEVISGLLYHFTLKISWHFHPWLLILPVIGAILIGCIGVWGTRRTINSSPLQVLREG